MANPPQNPFEYVQSILAGGMQSIAQGTASRVQGQQRAAEQQQQTALQFGMNALPELYGLISTIGDDDPDLVAALSNLAGQYERGILGDPADTAQLISQAQVALNRPTSAIEGPVTDMQGREVEGAPTHFRTATQATGHEVMGLARARAGDLERIRAMAADEQSMLADYAMKEFESRMRREERAEMDNYARGRDLINSATDALSNLAPFEMVGNPEFLAEYEGAINALRTLASSPPLVAEQIWGQATESGLTGYEALAAVNGLVTGLNDRQERLRARFDTIIKDLREDADKVRPEDARALVNDLARYMPRGYISDEEMNLLRAAANLPLIGPTTGRDVEFYVDNPDQMVLALEPYITDGAIDTARLESENHNLYVAFMDAPGIAGGLLEELYVRRAIDASKLVAASQEVIMNVLTTGAGFEGLTAAQKADLAVALGNPNASDEWLRTRVAQIQRDAARAAAADLALREANGHIAAMNLSGVPHEAAMEGDIPRLEAYIRHRRETDNPMPEGQAEELLALARERHDQRIELARYDLRQRQANADEAFRLMEQGRDLDPFQRASLLATYEHNAQDMRNLMALMPSRNQAEIVSYLFQIAESVTPDFWDNAMLTEPQLAAVRDLNLHDTLVATSRFAFGRDARSEAYANVREWMKDVPEQPETMLAIIDHELATAGVGEHVRDGFNRYIRAHWDFKIQQEQRAQRGEERADSYLELAWANHFLNANRHAQEGDNEAFVRSLAAWNTVADNDRMRLAADLSWLGSVGCATQPAVFGGTLTVREQATVNDPGSEFHGQSCGPHVNRYNENYRAFSDIHDLGRALFEGVATSYGIDIEDIDPVRQDVWLGPSRPRGSIPDNLTTEQGRAFLSSPGLGLPELSFMLQTAMGNNARVRRGEPELIARRALEMLQPLREDPRMQSYFFDARAALYRIYGEEALIELATRMARGE